MSVLLAGLLLGPFCPLAATETQAADPCDHQSASAETIQDMGHAAMPCCWTSHGPSQTADQVVNGAEVGQTVIIVVEVSDDPALPICHLKSSRDFCGYRDKFETISPNKRE